MNRNRLLTLLLLNVTILVLNVVVFSNAVLGLSLVAGNVMTRAVAFTVLFMSIALFLYVNYKFLFGRSKTPERVAKDEIDTLDKGIDAIRRYMSSPTFAEYVSRIIKQAERLRKRNSAIDHMLTEKFSTDGLSYGRFKRTIDDIERVMCVNIKSILNRIEPFDEDEYREIIHGRTKLSMKVAKEKLHIYEEYIEYVRSSVEDNDEILLKLDKLLSEISKLNSLSKGELENMQELQEIDALINDSRWYK